MSIKVAINHETHYTFDRAVKLSPHIFRLRPAAHSRTKVESYSLTITPANHFINWQQDPFGNYQARVVFPEMTTELKVVVDLVADLKVFNPFDFFLESYAEKYPFEYDALLKEELAAYLKPSEHSRLLLEWVSKISKDQKNTVDFLVYVNQLVSQAIAYTIRLEPGVQSCDETLQKKLGSCRDSGWLLVNVLRHMGLAARFVSGYLIQLAADEKALDGPSGPEYDFTDLHAWCEVYIPGAGWIGLDPTSGLFAGEGHIPLACTPEFSSAAAITGFLDPCESTMKYINRVQRIHEAPRVSKPYTETQWNDIVHLGYKVDEDLTRLGIALTMGGEPTFVSVDDMESEQWNSKADGEDKRKLAYNLATQLKSNFAPTGLMHHGQGKWYPGEPLPRWQYALYWRKDGKPLWKDASLLADIRKNYSYDLTHAKRFFQALASSLDLPESAIKEAYEDVVYYLWSEGTLPTDIDPLKYDLSKSDERKYVLELIDKGMNEPTGYVLPLAWSAEKGEWHSSIWKFRRKHLFLIPGNSPIGLRLPLSTIEHNESDEVHFEKDLFDYFEDLPPMSAEVKAKLLQDRNVRTAVSIEIRKGVLYIFMPPLTLLERYLELLSTIESIAKKIGVEVAIEGYTPPTDPRIEKLVVSPDPGVVEVNIQPAKSWKELLKNYDVLFECARNARLSTEKFMVDGRHVGTLGGNHITIGGQIPSESPLLLRPDLLRSLITFWQHHPGLSYLFAGPFVGPTSQAPRIDEGRDDKLYELEIAFKQLEIAQQNGQVPFYLVDRLLRNFLVDITGNTHRAEFCIDKLYSPDSSSGRLGILEFRAFDMPPHKHMCMVQLLLIRTLLSMFIQKPYKGKLIRWGTELHDKFLTPHYCMEDVREVIRQINEFGYEFSEDWLLPFYEFRFPVYGKVNYADIELELRMAIEPWHVLGEEAGSAGTARYVDSSLERVQVKLRGIKSERYILLCNGLRVQLYPTDVNSEYVGSVRYKAWNPFSSLHPTIQVQSPLVFDIYDLWNNRSIGGCRYYVSHPGGRSYDTFPVNSFEAESRRINRFWEMGHTPPPSSVINPTGATVSEFVSGGSQIVLEKIPLETINPEYPHILDLRQVQ